MTSTGKHMTIRGIHHVTGISGPAQDNLDFYVGVLGLRFVKRTVNFDDPGTYHFYFGDDLGRPGTILTFFPWSGVPKGRSGQGMTTETSFIVPEGSIEFWLERFADLALDFDAPETRFGVRVLPFRDNDGLPLALVESPRATDLPDRTYESLPSEHNIRGFDGVTLSSLAPDETTRILTDVFGYQESGRENGRVRYRPVDDGKLRAGQNIDLVESPVRGLQGAGTIHHVAFRVKGDDEQLYWRERVAEAGLRVTDVQERNYFRSIYFREPGGILFEIATDVPGFTADEPAESLGSELKLPEWYEPRRAELETRLPEIRVPKVS